MNFGVFLLSSFILFEDQNMHMHICEKTDILHTYGEKKIPIKYISWTLVKPVQNRVSLESSVINSPTFKRCSWLNKILTSALFVFATLPK